jgi:hypothetical protein
MTFRYRGEHRLGTVRPAEIPQGGEPTDVRYLGGLDDEAAAAEAQKLANQVLTSWGSKIARPPVTDEDVAKEIAP